MTARILYSDILQKYPPELSDHIWDEYNEIRVSDPRVTIVLDDDPTGTQTVYDLPVLTSWSIDDLILEFERGTLLFYILTNSRALPEEEAIALNREIGINLKVAAKTTQKEFRIISRSDSTLRGHYPTETNALKEILDMEDAVEVIVPAFFEGGRFTADNIHYVKEQEWLIPASETPFARDPVFGYKHSHLVDWIIEKSGSRVKKEQIISIGIEDIRKGDHKLITKKLTGSEPGNIVIINALCYSDLVQIAKSVLNAEKAGRKFIFRSAASLVAAIGGLQPKNLLAGTDLVVRKGNGLIIIGSYVPKTTKQFNVLKNRNPDLCFIELDLLDLKNGVYDRNSMKGFSKRIDNAIQSGQTTVLYTSRTQIEFDDGNESLEFGAHVSEVLVSIIRSLEMEPGYILAKGGITSSDIAVKALNIKRAMVLGQVIPGVPVWKSGEGSKWPEIPYIVFPGNVGDDYAINDVFDILG